jgi:oxygen-independent coproporphyrinogen-3 oxidase
MADLDCDRLGLYISIPFCRSKCTYCNFASGVYPASEHGRYVDRVIQDLTAAGGWAARLGVELPRRVDTVYLGGGTTSLLAPELLERLFAAMRTEFDFEADAEITVECAPGQIADETLNALVGVGVNRVSLGVQSFIDREAQVSGRLHNRGKVVEDLRRLREAGIANLNVDLIAGLAGQTLVSWEESLAALVECNVPHASVYMLEVDEDSRLGREMLGGGARYFAEQVPADDAIAQMYSVAIERLGAAGLNQYEISNFCRPGFRSRHNLRYWQRRPYLGLGLDASSMLRAADIDQAMGLIENGERHASGAKAQVGVADLKPGINPWPTARASFPLAAASEAPTCQPVSFNGSSRSAASQECYVLRSTTTDELGAFIEGSGAAETAWLSPARQHEEAWFLGLRLNEGVDVDELELEFGSDLVARAMEAVRRLAEAELVTVNGKTICLTVQGRLLSNDVFQEFLGIEREEEIRTF